MSDLCIVNSFQARNSRRDHRYVTDGQRNPIEADEGFAGRNQTIMGQFASSLGGSPAAAAAANIQASLAALQAGQLSLGQVRYSMQRHAYVMVLFI